MFYVRKTIYYTLLYIIAFLTKNVKKKHKKTLKKEQNFLIFLNVSRKFAINKCTHGTQKTIDYFFTYLIQLLS